MITFKQYLSESDALRKYTSTDQFGMYKGAIQREYDALAKAYPFDGGKLYRGLNFSTPMQYLNFRRSIRNGYITSDSISSWSPSLAQAKSFAVSPQVFAPTAAVVKYWDPNERVNGFIGVIVVIEGKKGVGIDVSKSEYAVEDEVILPPGTYKIHDLIIEKKWKHIVHRLDINQEVMDILDASKNVDADLIHQLFRYKGGQLYPEVKKRIVSHAVDTFIATNKFIVNTIKNPYEYHGNEVEYNLLFPDGSYEIYLGGSLGLLDHTVFDDVKDLISPQDAQRIKKFLVSKINEKTKILADKKAEVQYNHGFNRIVSTFGMKLTDFKYIAASYKNTYDRFNLLLRDYNKKRHFDIQKMTQLLQKSLQGPFR